ncbi:MAG: bifunctional helix-turn-helix domain-containing protein/methylated-DNA--[protein]-cysteine S-methyltransferase [Desulfobacterales bacterium]
MADILENRFASPFAATLKRRWWFLALDGIAFWKFRMLIVVARPMVVDVKVSLIIAGTAGGPGRPYEMTLCFGGYGIDMTPMTQCSVDYQLVERAIEAMQSHDGRHPSMGDVADRVGVSDPRFERLFKRWAGVAPDRFFRFLTQAHARRMRVGSDRILTTECDGGLLTHGPWHERVVMFEAPIPSTADGKGQGAKIHYGIHPSPFGPCLLAITDQKICGLRFVPDHPHPQVTHYLQTQWPNAFIGRDSDVTLPLMASVFPLSAGGKPRPLHVLVSGTDFQVAVWKALLKIPCGKAVTYGDIARHIGHPKAARAVGSAVGANPIPFLIPCHRVIPKGGGFGNYGEGPIRKMAILGWEAARRSDRQAANPIPKE